MREIFRLKESLLTGDFEESPKISRMVWDGPKTQLGFLFSCLTSGDRSSAATLPSGEACTSLYEGEHYGESSSRTGILPAYGLIKTSMPLSDCPCGSGKAPEECCKGNAQGKDWPRECPECSGSAEFGMNTYASSCRRCGGRGYIDE